MISETFSDWSDVYSRKERREIDAYSKHYGTSARWERFYQNCYYQQDMEEIFNINTKLRPDLLFITREELGGRESVALMHGVAVASVILAPSDQKNFHVFGTTSVSFETPFVDLYYRTRACLLRKQKVKIPYYNSIEYEKMKFNETMSLWNAKHDDDFLIKFEVDRVETTHEILPFILCPPSLTAGLLQFIKSEKKGRNKLSPNEVLEIARAKARVLFRQAFPVRGQKPDLVTCQEYIKFMTHITHFCLAAAQLFSCKVKPIHHQRYCENLRLNYLHRHSLLRTPTMSVESFNITEVDEDDYPVYPEHQSVERAYRTNYETDDKSHDRDSTRHYHRMFPALLEEE